MRSPVLDAFDARRRSATFNAVLIAMFATTCASHDDMASLDSRYKLIAALGESAAQMPENALDVVLRSTYEGLVRPVEREVVHNLDEIALKDLYLAASTMAFYTMDPTYVPDMHVALDELTSRRLATESDFGRMYRTLFSMREFQAAGQLAAEHRAPDLKPLPPVDLPRVSRSGAPTELVLVMESRRLVRRSADLKPATIVVIAYPLCHFTENAVRGIERDPILSRIFREHSLWIAPQSSMFDWEVFQKWNDDHPAEPMGLAYRRSEWPTFDDRITPTFYFVRDGAVVTKVVGWPPGGRAREITSALRQIGL